jgi:HAD superfamily hydrolase (TIGR01509 family)
MTGAVLWDMDGTLVDSEEYHWLSWRDTMQLEGVSITHDQFLKTFGQRNDSILPQWLNSAATPANIVRIGDSKEELYRKLVHEGRIEPLPGVLEWIERLREQGWRQAVASSAPRKNIEVVLDAMGLAGFFDALVSAEDVTAGKPDPQVFQKGAERLGMPPARCIVVEDAVPGVEAARRAGMRCIGVSRTAALTGADVMVRSLTDLPPTAFEDLGRG